jgi:ABC-type Fe3+ transport system substrate-binding protein
MWKIKNIDEFPDILISFGFENYFNIEFFHNLVEKRYFKSVWEGTNINSNFSNLGCVDNDGGYTIYSVSPYILLVDKKKLGGFKVPKRWSDLFKDEYRNNIIVEGGPKSVSAAVLHYIYKDYGEKGLKMLAHNVKDIWDAAKMAKIAGMSGNKGAAVYIIPWFFAKCCGRHDEDIIIIWPEDGAFIYPLYMMIKRSKWTEFHEIVKLITGKNFGNQCAKGCCPSLNPYVNNRLPENSSFRWIGWEYIRKNDFQKIRELANSIFMETWMNNK